MRQRYKELLKRSKIKIAIIGCGVSGLTCGIKILQEGYSHVQIVAKDLPPHTTSDVAAAIWRPYRMMPEAFAIPWAMESLKSFNQLSAESESGVFWMNLTEVYKRKRTKPEWMNKVKPALMPYVPEQYSCSYSVVVPLIDTRIYMPYLLDKFKQLGGIVKKKPINHLNELGDYSYVINCSGIGARQLVRDKHIFPIKGQVIRLSKPKGLDYGIVEYEDEMTYIYPRHNDCIVGSTAEENQWELSYDKSAADDLLKRAIKLCPAIKSADILEHKVGLRPARKEIRLDAEPLSMQTTVIHNYGHGGRGFTLSWGCAKEIVNLLNEYSSSK